jgi:hypothetical protein
MKNSVQIPILTAYHATSTAISSSTSAGGKLAPADASFFLLHSQDPTSSVFIPFLPSFSFLMNDIATTLEAGCVSVHR